MDNNKKKKHLKINGPTKDSAIINQKQMGMRSVVIDITDPRRKEEAIKRSGEETKRLAKENAIIAEIGRIISSTLNIEEVYERFAEEVKKLIPFDRIVINTINIDKATVKNVYMAGTGIMDRKIGEVYPLVGSGNAEMVSTKSTLLIQTEDFNGYKDRFPMLLSTFQAGFRSIMNVPLFSKGQIIGGLLLRSFKPCAYTDKDVRLAERISNQIAGIIATSQLITERQQVEEALRQESSFRKAIIEHATEGLCVCHEIEEFPYVAFTVWNDRMTEITGYSMDQINRLGWYQTVYPNPEVQARAIERMARMRQGDDIMGEEWEITRADGEKRVLSISTSVLQPGDGIVHVLGLMHDITERKQAEEEIKQTLSLLNATLESTADGVLVVDREGKIVSFNQKFLQMWRIPKSIILLHNDDRALAFVLDQLKDPEGFLAKVKELYKQPEDESFDLLEFKDGRWFERYSIPQWIGKQAVGRVWSFRDITDRKKGEEELVRYKNHLEELVKERTLKLEKINSELTYTNHELEQFAYVASHDLQEPLRMVTSYVQLLARRYQDKLDQDANEFIEFAANGAMRMHSLINDLLIYSRVGTRGKPLEPTDCEKVLDQSVNNLKMAIEENGAEVSHDPLPEVMADSSQLEQLFQNLVGNAIKFQGEEQPRVHISVGQNNGEWVFLVKDNGIGIDPEFKDRIFVIFQRLHGKEKYPGTGIGLAVCKKIVERHGGRIWVESEEGQGATFYFTLPTIQKQRG